MKKYEIEKNPNRVGEKQKNILINGIEEKLKGHKVINKKK